MITRTRLVSLARVPLLLVTSLGLTAAGAISAETAQAAPGMRPAERAPIAREPVAPKGPQSRRKATKAPRVIRVRAPARGAPRAQIRVQVEAADETSLQQVLVVVGGKTHRFAAKGKTFSKRVRVTLPKRTGRTRLRVVAINAAGVRSSPVDRHVTVVAPAASPPTAGGTDAGGASAPPAAELITTANYSGTIGASSPVYDTARFEVGFKTHDSPGVDPARSMFDVTLREADDGKVFVFDSTSPTFTAVTQWLTNGSLNPAVQMLRLGTSGSAAPKYITDCGFSLGDWSQGTQTDLQGYVLERIELKIVSVTFEPYNNGTKVRLSAIMSAYGTPASG